MAIHPRRKSDAARRANQIVRSRTVLVMLLLGIMTFAALFWRLYDLQIRQHAELQEKAISQQTRSAVVSASRGTIYDRNLNTLAISATAETVLVSPLDIEKSVESQKEEQAKAAQKAADKGQDYPPPVLRDQSYIARGLSRILGLEQGAIEERMEKTNSQYEILKKKTDQTISDEVRRFINGEIDPEGNEVPEKQRVKLRGVWLQPDSKRYYLYSSLASGVIGFVNGDGIGSVGLEVKYDDTLTGTAGYTISARNASGSELLYNYEQYYDAENGHSLVLTLDANVQLSLENGLENMLKKYDAKNGGTGIVMDVNTGAIIAMASYPNYDLNDYSTIFDAALQKSWTRIWRRLTPTALPMNLRRRMLMPGPRPSTAPCRASGAISASTPPMSLAPPSSPLRWRRRWRRARFPKAPRSTAAATLQFRAGATVSGAPTTAVTASRR